MDTNSEFSNRLIHCSSPYLLQHAHNPVDWNPWDEVAWKQALAENKLVLVSIGYSTCHWCHVMEKESFEDFETAEMMNQWFVNIKVDREERPDIDMVYMDACQVMTGRGGWPLNAICLPDKRPIFAGTYFPKRQWQQLLQDLQQLWKDEPQKALDYADQLLQGLKEMNMPGAQQGAQFQRAGMATLFEGMRKRFDPEHGGTGHAPKFPMPVQYHFLLDHYLCTGERDGLTFTNLSLLKMANGGINDQIRGGFCRYSTDREWFAPHFEKMLYDNAQLITLFARAYQQTDLYQFKEVLRNTIHFCNQELKSEGGGYFSGLDADSDGMEGKYYTFTDEELRAALEESEYQMASYMFGTRIQGNWEQGRNILHWPHPLPEVLKATGLELPEFGKRFVEVQRKLLAVQQGRNRPSLDHKIICSWNGMMLQGLATAGELLHQESWINQAKALDAWMWQELQQGGHLFRCSTSGQKGEPGFLEDYACYLSGLLALYQATYDESCLSRALQLADTLMAEFYDAESGLFQFSSNKSEALIFQKTDIADDVIPSGNSMLCLGLQQLGILCGHNDLYEAGKGLLHAAREQVQQQPAWHSNWCRAAQAEAYGILQVECTGSGAFENLNTLKKALPSWAVTAAAISDSQLDLLNGKFRNGENAIYICAGTTCFEPVTNAEQALELIAELLES